MNVHPIKPHILRGDMSMLRSSFKVTCHIQSFGHFFLSSRDRDFIFGMHMYLMKLHIFGDDMSRSRSSFKIKGQTSITFEPIEIET